MLSKSNFVYEFTCCCGQTYIGKTTQRLTEQAKQHLPSKLFTEETDLKIYKSDSAFAKHVKQNVSCLAESLRTKFKMVQSARCQSHPRSCPRSALHPQKTTNRVSTKEHDCACFVPCLMCQFLMVMSAWFFSPWLQPLRITIFQFLVTVCLFCSVAPEKCTKAYGFNNVHSYYCVVYVFYEIPCNLSLESLPVELNN